MHELVRDVDRVARREVERADPEDARVGVERAEAREAPNVGDAAALHALAVSAEREREIDALRVELLYRLHHAGDLCGREVHAFALAHAERPRVGPGHEHDGDPDRVEAGHVRDTRDAERLEVWSQGPE